MHVVISFVFSLVFVNLSFGSIGLLIDKTDSMIVETDPDSESVGRINDLYKYQGSPHGTGFLYNPDGHFFTTKQVISSCKLTGINAMTYDYQWHKARIIAIDSSSELVALSIDTNVEYFASFRKYPQTNYIAVPEDVEDVFSAAFSIQESIWQRELKWGQIQSHNDPNEPPFINWMRMDAKKGFSGAPVLDYYALLIGIIYEIDLYDVSEIDLLVEAGYGNRWVNLYNNNALIQFANSQGLQYAAWDIWDRKDPSFIFEHARRINVLIACEK